ncbi:MAG: DUF418 domain-containing protein [Planctomycetes bacterium]|nr:DUF418 domain-containing protein [Planctomycetota bacterium]
MSNGLAATMGSERIGAIDSVRGFALLGIFFVNIQAFGEPFGMFMLPRPEATAGTLDVVAYYFVKVFCESKFYPLFAMLFGFGLMLQAGRAAARGRSYWAPGFRRYGFLTLLGLMHALLLWYGDILFVYGIAGLFVLLLHRAKTVVLATLSGVFLFVGVVLMTGFSLLATPPAASSAVGTEAAAVSTGAQANAPVDGAAAERPEGEPAKDAGADAASGDEASGSIGDGKIPADATPVMRLFGMMRDGKAQSGPADPVWMALEREAYTSGNPLDRLAFNAFTWAMFLVVCLLGFGWDVIAMVLLGAVLCRIGLFDERRAGLRGRLTLLGVVVGLPMCAVGAFAGKFLGDGPAAAVFSFTSMVFGPLVSLAYLGAVTGLVRSGSLAWLTNALACVGRMSLTNYLLQTAVASLIFFEVGLGLFGETTRAQRVAIVLGVYACQLALSAGWLKVFAMGPMEWVWRAVTYLRVPGAKLTA